MFKQMLNAIFERFQKMSMSEAKQFFVDYHGHYYLMWHDDTIKYNKFKKMNISENILENWRQEIIQNIFDELKKENTNNFSLIIGRFVDVLLSTKTKEKENSTKLLTILERIPQLDEIQRIVLMEHMAGRNVVLDNGAIYFICAKTNIRKELLNILNKLSDFECTSVNQERYNQAMCNMRIAYDKYK